MVIPTIILDRNDSSSNFDRNVFVSDIQAELDQFWFKAPIRINQIHESKKYVDKTSTHPVTQHQSFNVNV